MRDLCAGIVCESDETCHLGVCTAECVSCPRGTACVGGACVTDPCKGTHCPQSEVCIIGALGEGQCAPNWMLEEEIGGASDAGETVAVGGESDSSDEPDMSDIQMMSGGATSDVDAGPDFDATVNTGGTSPPASASSSEPGGCLQGRDTPIDTTLWLLLVILGISRRHRSGRVI